MYQTILVPLDGSERAEAIMPHVEEMAHRFDAAVILLQVVESQYVAVSATALHVDLDPEGQAAHATEANAYLAALETSLREKGIKVRRYVEHGPKVEVIIDVAVREKADLIALASHGRTGLARVFYGSVAAGVLNRADRPLLLIRSRE